ncbi:helix-turn-helix domain-containing protein [Scandinavium sp. NPDC088450]|uniref:helix-turn-helix domain-containing protein n=1 Tax=Scandinavium sp. NPDC088450 TaxID=3364514 RepID=UPI003850A502
MLRIYGNANRPEKELDVLISSTVGCEEKVLKKWQRINTTDSNYIYVVVSGEVEFRRESDELCVFTLSDKCLFGFSSVYCNSQHMYGLVRADTIVRRIKKDEFSQLMHERGLWEELMKVLSWYISLLSKRDDVLIARSAYSIVREFLIEIDQLIIQHQRDVNIYDYIQEYTNLARSTIIKILADLKKGGYIVVEKGRLMNITSLPEKY